MALKIAFLILTIALTGASLLAVRQQRVQVVHEMTMHLGRAEQTDRSIWRARADLAAQITPARLLEMLEHKAAASPVFDEYCPPGTLLFDSSEQQAGSAE